jgi:hypothetical protein
MELDADNEQVGTCATFFAMTVMEGGDVKKERYIEVHGSPRTRLPCLSPPADLASPPRTTSCPLGPGPGMVWEELWAASLPHPGKHWRRSMRMEWRRCRWRKENDVLLVCLSAPALVLYLVSMGICFGFACRRDSLLGPLIPKCLIVRKNIMHRNIIIFSIPQLRALTQPMTIMHFWECFRNRKQFSRVYTRTLH